MPSLFPQKMQVPLFNVCFVQTWSEGKSELILFVAMDGSIPKSSLFSVPSNNSLFKLTIDLRKINNTVLHEIKHGFCSTEPTHFWCILIQQIFNMQSVCLIIHIYFHSVGRESSGTWYWGVGFSGFSSPNPFVQGCIRLFPSHSGWIPVQFQKTWSRG